MWKFLLESTNTNTNPLTDGTIWIIVVMIIGMGGYIFFISRRRKQTQQQVESMHDKLRPGMRVRTVGGVIGRIKEIREEAPKVKTVLLQTGSDKYPAYMLFDIEAIYGVFAEEGHTLSGQIIPKTEEKKEEKKEDSDKEEKAKDKEEKEREKEADKKEAQFKDDIFNAREHVAKTTSASSSKKKK